MIKYYLVFFISCLFLFELNGQNDQTVLTQRFVADNQLLEVDARIGYKKLPIAIGIIKNNQAYSTTITLRNGKHYYDLRQMEEWHGNIDYIIAKVPNNYVISSQLVTSTLQAEFDVFMEQEIYSPKIVNFAIPQRIYNFNFTILLFFLACILALAFFFILKKSLLVAAFIGVLVSILLLDVRNMANHWGVYQDVEMTYPYVEPISQVQEFVDKARPFIQDNNWAFQGGMGDVYFKLYIIYGLADKTFKATVRKKNKSIIYKVTRKPNQQQRVLVEANGFYLVQ